MAPYRAPPDAKRLIRTPRSCDWNFISADSRSTRIAKRHDDTIATFNAKLQLDMEKSSKYRDLSAERDGRDDSTAEAAESLMGRDYGDGLLRDQRERETGVRRICSTVRSWRWVIDLLLLLAIIGLLLDRRWAGQKYGEFEGAGDISGFAPIMSQQITTFTPDFSYAPENVSEFTNPNVKQKWIDLVPRGLGYVIVQHPESLNNLPTSIEGYNETVFTTSMTHQLHCLYSIMESFADMTNHPGQSSHMAWHVNHCFEYLRQSIMCCGDTALEGQQTTFPDGFIGSDGWDAKHVCKDYKQIFNYLDNNRVDDKAWIV